MQSLSLAAIGNCQIGSLLDERGRMVWTCLPQFDGDPAFCSLLMPEEPSPDHGIYEIELIDFEHAWEYLLWICKSEIIFIVLGLLSCYL